MKVPRHVVDERRRKLADLLNRHRYLPVSGLCSELGVSEATVRRDLVWLEENRIITRTYGGALAEFNQRFPSFRQRLSSGIEIKRELGRRAHALLRPGMTVYFDGGTTVHAVAEALRDKPVLPLAGVTINLPAADLLADVDGMEMHLTGGLLLRRQSVLGGAGAVHGVTRWRFDLALCSAQGMTREGVWNSDREIVALQKAVVARSRRVVFLLDSGKLGRTAPEFLLPWSAVHGLVTDAPEKDLERFGIPCQMTEVSQIVEDFEGNSEMSSAVPEAAGMQVDSGKSNLTLPAELL